MTGLFCGRLARRASVAALLIWIGASIAEGQSATATLVGTVVDSTGAVLPSAEVLLISADTARLHRTSSASDGAFTLSALPPGRYVLRVTLNRFAPAEIPEIALNVGDRRAVRVTLNVGTVGETATVVAESGRIQTSPAVGTVVDRQFVENMPLNGRSLHALLELTPGVVTSAGGGSGFSVNGQRTNANYFMVDGVGANAGMTASPSDTGAGGSPGYSAVGSTAGLVSVDALQEFRIETSSYAPEFGHSPGGQVSLVTRSGTNSFHGSLFEYFRHDALDATDWFVNNRAQPKPKLRQHDFGGVLGGAILRNRTFFFGSYEGLHLLQPKSTNTPVVTAAARAAVVPALQPYINALPLPNGRDLGNGTAEFIAGWSDPSRVDTTAVRVDHNLSDRGRLFGRWSQSPSYTEARTLAYVSRSHRDNTSLTLGATWTLSPRIVHETRFNYTTSQAPVESQPDDFGGAVPPTLSVFEQGRTPANTFFSFGVVSAGTWGWGTVSSFQQRQLNVLDSLVVTNASHEWKLGVDFRRLNPMLQGHSASTQGISVSNVASLLAARAASYSASLAREGEGSAVFDTLSMYAQDAWRLRPRLTLTYGLRWELVPPPHTTGGIDPVTIDGLEDPLSGQAHIAQRGTPLWDTRYTNFAPRIGASYLLSERPAMQLVVRGGYGVFYDLGYGTIATAFTNYPFTATKVVLSPLLPLTSDVTAAPDFDTERPSSLTITDRQLKQPFTHQWNVSAEQSLGRLRTVTVSYVGSEGRRLLKLDNSRVALREWPAAARTQLFIVRNSAEADYRALQVQFNQRLHSGVQAMAAYTWSRSRDTVSADRTGGIPVEQLNPELDFGYSDYDVTHNATVAATLQGPRFAGSRWRRGLLSNWSADLLVRLRSGFPLQVTTSSPFPPEATNQTVRANVVPGQPFWIEDSGVPGGRRLNRAAFTAPTPGVQGDLPRGILRTFNAKQVDLAVRREFGLVKGIRVQLRFEMFNVLNTPNFGSPIGVLQSPQFGVSNSMLSQSLGGLAATYQIGGPRSSQLALKFLF